MPITPSTLSIEPSAPSALASTAPSTGQPVDGCETTAADFADVFADSVDSSADAPAVQGASAGSEPPDGEKPAQLQARVSTFPHLASPKAWTLVEAAVTAGAVTVEMLEADPNLPRGDAAQGEPDKSEQSDESEDHDRFGMRDPGAVSVVGNPCLSMVLPAGLTNPLAAQQEVVVDSKGDVPVTGVTAMPCALGFRSSAGAAQSRIPADLPAGPSPAIQANVAEPGQMHEKAPGASQQSLLNAEMVSRPTKRSSSVSIAGSVITVSQALSGPEKPPVNAGSSGDLSEFSGSISSTGAEKGASSIDGFMRPLDVGRALGAEDGIAASGESPGRNSPVQISDEKAAPVGIRFLTTRREKVAGEAGPTAAPQKDGAVSGPKEDKMPSLRVDVSYVAHGQRDVGTEAATPVAPMIHEGRHPRFSAMPGDALISGLESASSSGNARSAPLNPPGTGGRAAVAAVEAIRQITDAADVLWATERSGVNLRLKLDDVGINVSVAYRDGEIRATFHADSPELRQVLTSAWEKHIASISDQKPYRFVEPVFSGSHASPTSDGGSSANSWSMGGDLSRQSSQQTQREEHGSVRRPRRANSTVAVSHAASATTRLSDNAGRLRAFA